MASAILFPPNGGVVTFFPATGRLAGIRIGLGAILRPKAGLLALLRYLSTTSEKIKLLLLMAGLVCC